MNDQTHKGGCLCGAVTYRIAGPLRDVVACHCSQCRKTSGHYVSATAARADDLTIAEGAALRWYRSSQAAERGFCGVCGSNLFWRRVVGDDGGSDEISVMAGGLEGPTGLTTTTHIFVQDAGDYYDLPAGAHSLEHGAHGLKPTDG